MTGGGAEGLLGGCRVLLGSSRCWYGVRGDRVPVSRGRSRFRSFFLGFFYFASSCVFVSHTKQHATNRPSFPGWNISNGPTTLDSRHLTSQPRHCIVCGNTAPLVKS